MFTKNSLIELIITDIAFGGAAVAKWKGEDGRDFVVFVEGRTAPGDRIEARLLKIKKNFAEAKCEKILVPSPGRITPRCRHFEEGCGGCSLQFFTYEDQLKWKEKVVAENLRKLGGFVDVKVEPILGCTSPWFYRNKMEYSFSPLPPREKSADSPSILLGLHPAKNFRHVFQLQECFLESPLSVEILKAVREWAEKLKLKPYDAVQHEGVLKNLVVREGKNTGEILVNLITNGNDFPQTKTFATWIMKKFPQITSLYHTAVIVKRGSRTIVDEFHIGGGKPTLMETLNVGRHSLKFDILPQAFFQPNTKQAEVLYGKVLEFGNNRFEDGPSGTGERGAKALKDFCVLDAFCGTGTIGMFFAKAGARAEGVDLNESAIENAKANAIKNGLKNIEFVCDDVGKFLAASSGPYQKLSPSLLITDPPRAGIAPNALEKLIALKIPRWIYVSCNPTTLARDLKIACEQGYKINKVQPVDMFPQTYHVESVVLLTNTNKMM